MCKSRKGKLNKGRRCCVVEFDGPCIGRLGVARCPPYITTLKSLSLSDEFTPRVVPALQELCGEKE